MYSGLFRPRRNGLWQYTYPCDKYGDNISFLHFCGWEIYVTGSVYDPAVVSTEGEIGNGKTLYPSGRLVLTLSKRGCPRPGSRCPVLGRASGLC